MIGSFIRILVAAALALAAAIGSAQALTLEIVPGTTVELSEAAGLCTVERNGMPAERHWFGQMESLQRGTNKLLSLHASCAAVEAVRSGRDGFGELQRWMVVLTPVDSEVRNRSESRDGFIRRFGDQLQSRKAQDSVAAGVKTVSERIKAIFSDGSLKMENLGELARDTNALYWGVAMTANAGGQQQRIAAVSTVTLVKGTMININFYKHYAEPADYDALVREARIVLADFVSRNDQPTWSIRESDWERLRTTLLIGSIGVACTAVFWFIKRRQKKPPAV